MPIDASIYSQMQAPDIAGGMQQGLKMRDMLDQRQANQQKMQQEKKQRDIELIARVIPNVKDQESYTAAKQHLSQNGVDLTGVPDSYDPELVGRYGQMIKSLATPVKDAQDMAEKQREFDLRIEDQKLRREEMRSMLGERRADRKEAQDQREHEKQQTLNTPFGTANTPDDAKQLKEAYESKQNFDSKIQDMIALRKKHNGGALLNREDVGRGKQLSKDALLEYKNMAKLGVLSKADEDIINAIIPDDPLEYNSPIAAIQGQDPILHKLEKFKSDKDKDFQTRVQTRTRSGLMQGPQSGKPQTVIQNGHTYTLNPLTGKYE